MNPAVIAIRRAHNDIINAITVNITSIRYAVTGTIIRGIAQNDKTLRIRERS